jgi:hypothetical protein
LDIILLKQPIRPEIVKAILEDLENDNTCQQYNTKSKSKSYH